MDTFTTVLSVFSTVCAIAVSYTHLDVYKRQFVSGEITLNVNDLLPDTNSFTTSSAPSSA